MVALISAGCGSHAPSKTGSTGTARDKGVTVQDKIASASPVGEPPSPAGHIPAPNS
jgi:hypothetical protein